MPTTKYTLIMTRGTHTVSKDDADRILRAVENEDKTIDADVEFTETLGRVCKTTLIVAHVVGLVEKSTLAAAPVRHLASVVSPG